MKPVQNYTINNGVMLASCDIKAGDVILVEEPLASGPGRQGYPVCLSCFQFVDGSYFCNKCGWQLCSEACEETANTGTGSHDLDCSILSDQGISCDIYDFDDKTLNMDFMGPLRLAQALKQHKDRALVESLLKINTYNEKRKGKYGQRFFIGCEDMILKSLRDGCKLEGYTDEQLLTIIGLFEMYSFPLGPSGAKAFHLGPCFMKSSCKPNSYCMILSNYSIMYKASVDIKKGQPITRCYGDVTKSTFFRRLGIEDQYMFLCECDRCRDGSELGTNLGGILCLTCDKGIIVPTSGIEPETKPWKCNNSSCGHPMEGPEATKAIKFLNSHVQSAIEDSQGSIKVFELILFNKGDWSIAQPKGQFILDVKKQYLTNLGNVPGSTYEALELEKLEMKLELCREYLKMLNTVHPGYNYQKVAIIEICRNRKGVKSSR